MSWMKLAEALDFVLLGSGNRADPVVPCCPIFSRRLSIHRSAIRSILARPFWQRSWMSILPGNQTFQPVGFASAELDGAGPEESLAPCAAVQPHDSAKVLLGCLFVPRRTSDHFFQCTPFSGRVIISPTAHRWIALQCSYNNVRS